MAELRPCQRYQGGAAHPGSVECALCCTTVTSGSWRRGWPASNGSHANLCNRCGQRWAKSGRHPGPPHQAGRPSAVQAEAATALSLKRPRELQPLEAACWDGLAASPDGSSPPTAWTPLQWQGADGSAHGTSPDGITAGGGARQYVSYCIQKLAAGRAHHALFWLQDASGRSTLAVVGTDARLTGHFTYATVPGCPAGPALRCTNRAEVAAWLASFGVVDCLPEGRVALPELGPAERRLLSGGPVWAGPQLEGCWAEVREESGRVADGRHYKRFWLVGASGQERLAVTGLDSARQDRRYKYHAARDLGGFAFENSREVLDWIAFVLGRGPEDPVQPRQTRAAAPLPESELASFAQAGRSGSGGGSGTGLSVRVRPPRSGSPPPAGAATPPGLVRCIGPWTPLCGSPHFQEFAAMPSGDGGPAARRPSGGKVKPRRLQFPDPPPAAAEQWRLRTAPSFRCGGCGALDHATDECPALCLSPPSLIAACPLDGLAFHPTLDDPALAGGLATPRTRPLLAPGGGSGDLAAPHGAGRGSGAFLLPQGTEPAVPLGWAPGLTGAQDEPTLLAWAQRLRGWISDAPPQDSSLPWVPVGEALALLRELATSQVSLPLLQASRIDAAVAALRWHPLPAVAAGAAAVVGRWRGEAAAALHHASMGLG